MRQGLDASLAPAVVAASTRAGSRDHGEQHWKAVAWAGLQVAPVTSGCDPELVLLFALFHDSQRWTEYSDPEHGERGGALARKMCGDAYSLDADRLELLVDACARHDKGFVTGDPTVGVCWDSDRLNLWRVGIRPDPRLLSTERGRDAELIDEAQAFHGMTIEWGDLFAPYSRLLG